MSVAADQVAPAYEPADVDVADFTQRHGGVGNCGRGINWTFLLGFESVFLEAGNERCAERQIPVLR